MQAKVGNRIVIEPAKVTQPGCAGTIEQVLRAEPPTYRVKWDDDGRPSMPGRQGAHESRASSRSGPREALGLNALDGNELRARRGR